jgi:hypothetical protein
MSSSEAGDIRFWTRSRLGPLNFDLLGLPNRYRRSNQIATMENARAGWSTAFVRT